jgi:hypothetical protein
LGNPGWHDEGIADLVGLRAHKNLIEPEEALAFTVIVYL